MKKALVLASLFIMTASVWGMNSNNPYNSFGSNNRNYVLVNEIPEQWRKSTENTVFNTNMRPQYFNIPNYRIVSVEAQQNPIFRRIIPVFLKLSDQESQMFLAGSSRLSPRQLSIFFQQIIQYQRVDYKLDCLATEALKRGPLIKQNPMSNQIVYQASQGAEKVSTSQNKYISEINVENEIYKGIVGKYMQSNGKDEDAFQKSVQFFRGIGLTDKKIAYDLGYFRKIMDSREELARNYLKLSFGTQLDINGNKNAQDEVITVLEAQKNYRLYISSLLGINYDYLLKNKEISPKKRNIESEITAILNKYEREKDLNTAVREAASKLYYGIGFTAYRVVELLELPYKTHSYKESDVERKFSNRSKNLKNKDRNAIKDARKKGALYFFNEVKEEVWQIADFFGVERREIRKYIENSKTSQTSETRKRRDNQDNLFIKKRIKI